MVTEGVAPYPTPLPVTVKFLIPFRVVSIEQVAAAPTPLPPTIVIMGGAV